MYNVFHSCEISLVRVECLDDGEIGKAEPYLWAAFFKIDGMNSRLNIDSRPNADGKIIGKFELLENQDDYAIVAPPINWTSRARNGHKNIGEGMNGGETRRLTSIKIDGRNPFKHYFGDFLPIPIYMTDNNGTVFAEGINAPGILGCVAVLMEEDHTPHDAVLVGFRALLTSLQQGLNTLMEEYEFDFLQYVEDALAGNTEMSIPEEAIDNLKINVGSEVYNATKSHILEDSSIWDQIKAAADSDDTLGTGVWYFTSEDMPNEGFVKIFGSDVWTPMVRSKLPIGPRWISAGRWRVEGQIKSKKCFIATQVFESPYHPKVMFLQHWRDNFLSKTKIGQEFIQVYYTYSPSVAKLISNSTLLKRISKGILDIIITLINIICYRRVNLETKEDT